MSALTLAYVGDAVFTLFVRIRLTAEHDFKPGELTRLGGKMVSAAAQAAMYETLQAQFSEEEASLAKRCRNAHVNNKAKNYSLAEYMKATALEGVLGYLKLCGREERLQFLLERCWEIYNEQSR